MAVVSSMHLACSSRLWRSSCSSCLFASRPRPGLSQSPALPTSYSPMCRAASTSANPYPFPSNSKPAPHQIFHLPKSATRADVKARYYDLVRIYHPDSPSARAGGISPETAHSRFQAISSAYAVLSGKKSGTPSDDEVDVDGLQAAPRTSYHDISTAMWRAKQRRRAELDIGIDDRWKERMMLGAVLLTIALFVLQTYTTRARAMSEARHAHRTPSRSASPSPTSLDASLGSDQQRIGLDMNTAGSNRNHTP